MWQALPPPPAIQDYQQTIKASINDNERNARLALPQSEPLNIPKGQEAPMAHTRSVSWVPSCCHQGFSARLQWRPTLTVHW